MILCDGLVDLRLGDWREVLADVETCDAVITDPPYSARTHAGQHHRRESIGYLPWGPVQAAHFSRRWAPACRGWIVVQTDDRLSGVIRKSMHGFGRMTFPHVPVLQHAPRLTGDGPGPPGHSLVVSRPRERRFLSWGSLPPWYEAPREVGAAVIGAKPLGLMRAVVRDYTRPGDLVVDPFCGGGTTALACAMEGRRCITSEIDPVTFARARARLERGLQPGLL